MRSFDSYSATAARITSAATAAPTVRPTSARSRLGANSLPRIIVAGLEARDHLLTVDALDPVDERLDRRLQLCPVGAVDGVQRAAGGGRAVREVVAGGGDIVDREQLDVSRAERLRVHRHHADRVL